MTKFSLPSETYVGRVHVSDLAPAEAFYSDMLGLDVTQRGYPGALFLSAGGYHHHLGLNVWAGAGAAPPPPDAVGLRSFALALHGMEVGQTLQRRIREAGVETEDLRGYEHTVPH